MNSFETQLIEVLTDVSGHLSNITKELEKISTNTSDIAYIDGDDCTEDIAKNIADMQLELSSKLTDIACFVSEVAAK